LGVVIVGAGSYAAREVFFSLPRIFVNTTARTPSRAQNILVNEFLDLLKDLLLKARGAHDFAHDILPASRETVSHFGMNAVSHKGGLSTAI
jgi:hypothetical protein